MTTVEIAADIEIPDGYTAGPVKRLAKYDWYLTPHRKAAQWVFDEPSDWVFLTLLPEPKWRPATPLDLVGATGPIYCRVRDSKSEDWRPVKVDGYIVGEGGHPWTWRTPLGGKRFAYWRFCEILA